MDQFSKLASQPSCNEESDSNYPPRSTSMFLLTTSIPIQSLTLQADTSTTARSETSAILNQTDMIEYVRTLFFHHQNMPNSSLNFYYFSPSLFTRVPRGLRDTINHSFLHNFGDQQVLSPRVSRAFELSNQFGRDIDVIRQQYAETTLLMRRVADNLLESSMSLMILAADVEANSRLVVVSQDIQWLSTVQTHDRYGDMRLDVDNMSYEELLALEDQIGDINTGLSEEAIAKSLKQSKFYLFAEENAQKECCTICQENYEEEDGLGTLICGHCFHMSCIKEWLRRKDLCPLCKTTCLGTTYPSFSSSL